MPRRYLDELRRALGTCSSSSRRDASNMAASCVVSPSPASFLARSTKASGLRTAPPVAPDHSIDFPPNRGVANWRRMKVAEAKGRVDARAANDVAECWAPRRRHWRLARRKALMVLYIGRVLRAEEPWAAKEHARGRDVGRQHWLVTSDSSAATTHTHTHIMPSFPPTPKSSKRNEAVTSWIVLNYIQEDTVNPKPPTSAYAVMNPSNPLSRTSCVICL
jgi:hypothetical protein